MTLSPQPLDNSTISAFGAQVPKSVVCAIHDASRKSGTDFSYLMKQAAVESSFDPNAKAKGSTATGLYQFIQSTWLDMVGKYGDKYGIDTSMPRKDLLALRKDPEISSCMAAELAQENGQFLHDNWGGDVGETELYMAHFMGAGGAASFLKAKDSNPMVAAADLFPEAAQANRSVFYDTASGRSRSVGEVYALFDKKFNGFDPEMDQLVAAVAPEANTSPAQQAVASAESEPAPVMLPENSVVFSMRKNYGAYGAGQTQAERLAAVSNYRQMMTNPVELMMLSQLDPSSDKKSSGFF